jgi:hypothetical protein
MRFPCFKAYFLEEIDKSRIVSHLENGRTIIMNVAAEFRFIKKETLRKVTFCVIYKKTQFYWISLTITVRPPQMRFFDTSYAAIEFVSPTVYFAPSEYY